MIRTQFHRELIDMVDELMHQRAIDDYKVDKQFAFLAVVYSKIHGGKSEIKDFVGEPPKRQRDVDEGIQKARRVAKAKGVNVPDGRG